MIVTIAGGSGFVGRPLAAQLIRQNHQVRTLSRRPRPNDPPGVQAVACDLRTGGEALAKALEESEVCYYLVHSLGGEDFEQADREAAGQFSAACANAGVRRIIYLGALRVDGTPSRHLRSRYEVGEILSSGKARVTTLRSGLILGAGSATFELLRDVLLRLPMLLCPSWTRSTRIQPIAMEDMLRYLLRCLDDDRTVGLDSDAVGPEVTTYLALLRSLARLLRRCRLFVPMPGRWLRTSQRLIPLLTSRPTLETRLLLDNVALEMVSRSEDLRRLFPEPLLGVDRALAVALGLGPDAVL